MFFVLLPNKDGRFLVPLLPALALMTAAGIQHLGWKPLRVLAWTLVVAVGTYQFYTISFGWPQREDHYYTHPPSMADWRYERILLSLDPTHQGRPFRIAVLANDPYFEPNLFQLVAQVRSLPYVVDGFGDAPQSVQHLSDYNVFITKTGSIAIAHTAKWRERFRDQFNAWIAAGNQNPRFTLWRTWSLPDGSWAQVYFIK